MNTTDKVWGVAIGALLVYEGYTVVNKVKGDTLSESVWKHLPRRPIIPFTLGFLLGHFVWQSQDIYDREIERTIHDGEIIKEKITEEVKHG